jgi:hypothetical protein
MLLHYSTVSNSINHHNFTTIAAAEMAHENAIKTPDNFLVTVGASG